MTKFICEKSDKNNLRKISKQYTHLPTILNTYKVSSNQNKTVGGDAYTRYLVSMHFCRKNDSVHFVKKSDKKSEDIAKTICIFSDHDLNTYKISKQSE